MEFLYLGGLGLSKFSGCGKWKMKEVAFPASQVTVCKVERERRRWSGGGGRPPRGRGAGALRKKECWAVQITFLITSELWNFLLLGEPWETQPGWG